MHGGTAWQVCLRGLTCTDFTHARTYRNGARLSISSLMLDHRHYICSSASPQDPLLTMKPLSQVVQLLLVAQAVQLAEQSTQLEPTRAVLDAHELTACVWAMRLLPG